MRGPSVDFSGRNSIGNGEDEVVPPNDGANRTCKQLERAQLDALVRHLPGAVYRCESEAPRRVIYLTDQIEELTGYSAEAFLTDQIRWTNLIHPADRGGVEASLAAELAEKGHFSIEYRILHRSGDIRW